MFGQNDLVVQTLEGPAKDAAAAAAAQKEREERIRALKDKQNEERQRKLEELKQQAQAAQRFREQKEEERRRRIEELRQRDQDRRSQVEERKRQLWEHEREKREQLIKKTQEREARLEAKRRNERSSIVFAFGSSTPRMLEPSDTGGSYWGSRRYVHFGDSVARKLRATSAHALDRKPGEDIRMSSSMYEVFHWDLDSNGAPPMTAARPPRPPLSLAPQNPPHPVPVPRGRKSPAPRLPGKALSLPPQSPPPLSPVHPSGSVRGERA
ncbi:hypothetical protein B566_EDAN014714 [Ephemera danica]|nr:hypothetical protein B566_EDAN014714 [Ephemera danica]